MFLRERTAGRRPAADPTPPRETPPGGPALTHGTRPGQELAYNPALDGLRAVAVLAVLLYHGQVGWARGGFLGVDVFFVLSGYLITGLLLQEWHRWGSIDLRRFWTRRARRLLPALFVVIVACSVYGVTLAAADKLGRLRGDALATLFYVANWHFIASGQSYFDQYGDPSPLRHMWSLAIEEQFYLLWPLLLTGLLVLSRRRAWSLVWLLGGATLGSAALMAHLYVPGTDPSRVYYGTDTRAQALLVGAGLAALMQRRRTDGPTAARPPRVLEFGLLQVPLSALAGTAWLALGGLLTCCALFRESTPFLYRGGFLIVAALSAVVVAGAHFGGPLHSLLSAVPLRLVGVISYGLYLWHWPLYVVLTPDRTGLTGPALLLARLAATFAAAAISFVLVEHPIRTGALRRLRRPVARLAIAGSVLLVAGTTIAATTGATPAPDQGSQLRSNSSRPDGGPAATGTAVQAYLVGDSVPLNLREEYPGNEIPGLEVQGSSLLGCGLLPYARSVDGVLHPLTQDCLGWQRSWQEEIARTRPDVGVIFLGIGEQFDQVVHSRTIRFGTAAYAEHLRRALTSYVDHMHAAAKAVAVVTVPCHGVLDTGLDPEAQMINDETRVRWLNDFLKHFAAVVDVPVLDMHTALCSRGYTNTRRGVTLRKDGLHFTHEGAGAVWAWLGPQLLDLARR